MDTLVCLWTHPDRFVTHAKAGVTHLSADSIAGPLALSQTTLCPLTLAGVTNLKDGSPVKYGMHKQLSSDKYVIG